jgi:glutathione synthase/RimK-type ligase-like ATP-grasp enzyme
MNTLIMTRVGDIHAHAVKWAHEQLGHRCYRWFAADTGTTGVELHLSGHESFMILRGPDGEVASDAIDAVWMRRLSLPSFAHLRTGDQMVAAREMDNFIRGLWFAFPQETFWANPPSAAYAGCLKATALVAARRVGLSIPRTLMSNDMTAVRAFVDRAPGRVAVKGFRPAVWKAGSNHAVLQTTILEAAHLADEDSLRLSPAIFQDFVPKAFELRIAVFGETCIAAKITNQDDVDWRSTYEMTLEPYQLPDAVQAKLLAFMRQMGLVMGAIDMIVTPEGEHVFIEVNEQGQMLWVEDQNPDIALLEPLVHFLISGDPRFVWKRPRQPTLRFADWRATVGQTFMATEARERTIGNVVVSDLY